jgi:hypothetical protein
MFDIIPDYTGEGEKAKNPKPAEAVTQGILVSGKTIDPELLYKLALMGANNKELGDFFGVPESQIRYYFSVFLTKARASLKMKLRRAQLKVAIENENPTMLIWLGRNMLDQTDHQMDTQTEQVLPWITETETETE